MRTNKAIPKVMMFRCNDCRADITHAGRCTICALKAMQQARQEAEIQRLMNKFMAK